MAGVLRQVAPGAIVLPLRVLGPGGSGKAGNVADAIRFAVDQGAQMIHLSIAAPVASESVRAALQVAASRGVLIVAACGNDGSGRPEAPANALDGKNPLGRSGVSVSAVQTDGLFPSGARGAERSWLRASPCRALTRGPDGLGQRLLLRRPAGDRRPGPGPGRGQGPRRAGGTAERGQACWTPHSCSSDRCAAGREGVPRVTPPHG